MSEQRQIIIDELFQLIASLPDADCVSLSLSNEEGDDYGKFTATVFYTTQYRELEITDHCLGRGTTALEALMRVLIHYCEEQRCLLDGTPGELRPDERIECKDNPTPENGYLIYTTRMELALPLKSGPHAVELIGWRMVDGQDSSEFLEGSLPTFYDSTPPIQPHFVDRHDSV